MKITNLRQFEDFLKSRIPSREALFMGDIGIKRAKYFMRLLGNPQNKLRVIHIAGTSGKGSTAYLTSHILQSQGFKVGLSISPHVFDIRERMQVFRSTAVSRTATTNGGHTNEQVFCSTVASQTRTTKAGHTNNTLLSEKTVLKYFNQILPIILKMEKSKYGSPTFFEINVGLAYYIFQKEKVDYAVMETGLGGTLDATNTATNKNKICIITKLGLDHTEILGKTISKIASEKAGIIQKQNTVISTQQTANAQKIIRKKCEEKNAELLFISKKNYSVISSTPTKTVFDFKPHAYPSKTSGHFPTTASKCPQLKKIELGLIGKHQAENCSLALSCLFYLSKRDKFGIDENLLRNTLRNITIPGRMETRIINGQKFIFDGAHNPQKMETFLNNLSFIYPVKSSSPSEIRKAKGQSPNFTGQAGLLPTAEFNRVDPNQKFIFAVAFKKGKDWQKMLKKIIPTAEKIYLSEFSTSNQDNHLNSVSNEDIAKFLLKNNFKKFQTIKQKDILKIKSKKPIIITGSLYFIGSLA